jgi:hypothetical protein
MKNLKNNLKINKVTIMTNLNLTQNEIRNKANIILREIHTIEPIYGIDSLHFNDIDFTDEGDSIFVFKGEVSHKNTKDPIYYSFPEELIYDETKKIDYLSKLKLKVESEQMTKNDKDIKSSIEQYLEIKNKVEKEAMIVLSQINEIETISGYSYLEISDFDNHSIEFFGEEHWRYGGYDSYSFEFPTHLLFNSTSREIYMNKLKNRVELKNKKEKEHKDKLANEKKDRDHKKYLELKNQFEANGE